MMSVLSLSILFTPEIAQATTIYPYSVKIGDTVDYHVDTLKNGTKTGPLNVYGLSLSQGDNFQMEIFTGVAQSTNYLGSDYSIKFIKGDNKSIALNGASYLYTSNKSFWDLYSNSSQDIGGQVYTLTRINNSITYSWTLNADNFITITFNPNDGLLTSYERATTNSNYNYTHFKFSKGSSGFSIPGIGNVPGYELPASILALLSMSTVIILHKKRQI